jgi:hypothetical protein
VAVGASPVVLGALVRAHPAACAQADAMNCLPVHAALLRGAPASAVACLIKATPDSDRGLGDAAPSDAPPEARPLSAPDARPLSVPAPEARPLVAPTRGPPRGAAAPRSIPA